MVSGLLIFFRPLYHARILLFGGRHLNILIAFKTIRAELKESRSRAKRVPLWDFMCHKKIWQT